ncbi:MAG: stage III sporulation protein AF [Clostridia bacterium]|nr:stage III sporulation protein AF [Clostridia bacterium]
MVGKLKLWTQNIIISVVISIIIEMILPDGSNKKYVKVVSGLYILYVIINPILNLGSKTYNFELKNLLVNEQTVATFSENDVAKTYILSMENALKAKIEEMGYMVEMVEFTITSDYSEIVKIEVKMKIGASYDSKKIIDLIKETYSINNIVIN